MQPTPSLVPRVNSSLLRTQQGALTLASATAGSAYHPKASCYFLGAAKPKQESPDFLRWVPGVWSRIKEGTGDSRAPAE